MRDYLSSTDEAFNEALQESAFGLGFDTEEFASDGFGGGDHYGLYEEEGDAFSFGKAFKSLGSVVNKLPLKSLAKAAATVAGGAIGGPVGARLGGMVGGLLGEEEMEEEGLFEEEEESGLLQEEEAELFGLDSFTDSMAESLAVQAAESDSEEESSSLVGGITITIVTPAPVQVRKVAPALMTSANRLRRFLRRRRATRPLVKAIPGILKKSTQMLTNHARQGGTITPALAKKAMAQATAKPLRTPAAAARTLANNAVKSQRLGGGPGTVGGRNRISTRAIARAER